MKIGIHNTIVSVIVLITKNPHVHPTKQIAIVWTKKEEMVKATQVIFKSQIKIHLIIKF